MSLLATIHPARVAACFRARGASAAASALLSEPRFADRLEVIVASHYQLPDGAEASDADRAIAALDLGPLEALAFRAGIVVHAGAFVREIRGPVLSKLAERFGADALDNARAHLDLAIERPAAADLDALEGAVRQDGQACLAAWIAALPASLRRQVSLKWRDDAEVPTSADAELLQRAPAIIRRLASSEEQPA